MASKHACQLREVRAFAADDGRLHVGHEARQMQPYRVQLRQQFIADAVALGRPIQAHVQHRAGSLEAQQSQAAQCGGGVIGQELEG